MAETLTATASRVLEAAPLLTLTGAGISSGSGIPTYRDERGIWLRSAPITHQEFLRDPRQRQRYWGRSTLGWPAVRDARPTAAHRALAAMQHRGMIARVVTQNVDRLHQCAGSEDAIDLHGRLDQVICLQCGDTIERDALQGELLARNPWLARPASSVRPDGDADLAEHEVDAVAVPDCASCGGMLMPDVVFFGGSIPRQRIEASRAALERAGGLLVVGSSLQVYSGYRFCRWAKETGKPLFIINPGATRGDSLADARIPLAADAALAMLSENVGIPAAQAVPA